MLESEQLKKTRGEVVKAKVKTLQLQALAEEGIRKAKEAVTQLAQFQENIIVFQRDMAMMRRVMHENEIFRNDSETQSKKNTNV